ncbi:MAG: response regulator transcription factor [Bacteroidia bacterium]|jgi:two-component system alkaline phosphatase synthesis response regulator PhoP|nr:response regulator transcription factor [Bacteroidia bacterium]MDP1800866.1 response regulator transcription factor [Bacteroidota bacterium]
MSNSNFKILLVDDEPDIVEFLGYNLKKEGYTILTANNGKDAVEIAKKEIPHLIVLDVMMPDMDGIETCRELREQKNLQEVLIAFLTARSEDYTQIAGFEVGADDYITKPIKPRVFISRVKALLRRLQANNISESVIEFGNIRIDKEKHVVYKGQEEIALPKKEFKLFSLLSSKPGKVFTREFILDTVWGDEVVVGDRTIDVHIRKLREKIGDDYFKTVKGVGYKFEF